MAWFPRIIRIGIFVLFVVTSLIVAQSNRGISGQNDCERRLRELEVTAEKLRNVMITIDVDTLMESFSKKQKTVIGVDIELTWTEVERDLKEKGDLLYPIFFDSQTRRKLAGKGNIKSVRDYLTSAVAIGIDLGYHPFFDESKCKVGYIRYHWEGMSKEDRDYLGTFYLSYHPDEGGWKITTYSSYY